MKIISSQLRQIIREEITRTLREGSQDSMPRRSERGIVPKSFTDEENPPKPARPVPFHEPVERWDGKTSRNDLIKKLKNLASLRHDGGVELPRIIDFLERERDKGGKYADFLERERKRDKGSKAASENDSNYAAELSATHEDVLYVLSKNSQGDVGVAVAGPGDVRAPGLSAGAVEASLNKPHIIDIPIDIARSARIAYFTGTEWTAPPSRSAWNPEGT